MPNSDNVPGRVVLPEQSGTSKRVAGFALWPIAWALMLAGALGLLIAGATMLGYRSSRIGGSVAAMGLLSGLIGVSAAWTGKYLLKLSRGLRQQSAAEKLEKDHRPPVLLLRSFRRDGEPSPRLSIPSRGFATTSLLGLAVEALEDESSMEDLIVAEFETIGPVIALGSPREHVSTTGASRYYAASTEWRMVITRVARKAAVVLIVLDNTPEMHWEVGQTALEPGLERVLFLLPRVRPADWWSEWRSLRETFNFLPAISAETVAIGYDEKGVARLIDAPVSKFCSYEHDVSAYMAAVKVAANMADSSVRRVTLDSKPSELPS